VSFRGFIDLHTHGIQGYDTRTGDYEKILKMAELHGSRGARAILLSIYPGKLDQMRRNMEAVRRAMEVQRRQAATMQQLEHSGVAAGNPGGGALCNSYPPGLILGVHLEGPFLNPKRCGALEKSSFTKPSVSFLKNLVGGYEEIVKIITIAPEMPGALPVIERCSGMGIKVNMGHSDATWQEAVKGKKAGATGITHLFNAMRPFHHREPGLAGLGLIDEDLYTEVIADGVHIHAKALELIFSLKRLDRIILVSDSVKSEKKKGMAVYQRKGVLAGSRATLSEAADLLRSIGIPEAEIIEAALDNPGRYIGYPRPGNR
jgi:N-acetylglucosamine-6-phosphate deacetylase